LRPFALRGPGVVARGAVGRLSHDEQLQQDVCAALLRTPGLDASRIVVGAFEHGWVTLLGRVSTRRQRQLTVQVARLSVARLSVGCSAVRSLLEIGEEGREKAEHAASAAGRQLAERTPARVPRAARVEASMRAEALPDGTVRNLLLRCNQEAP
jgi:BON domain-containing protein